MKGQLKTKKNKIRNDERQCSTKFTLMDLVAIFIDEARKVCKNEVMANSIALESLSDYIRRNSSNTKVVC